MKAITMLLVAENTGSPSLLTTVRTGERIEPALSAPVRPMAMTRGALSPAPVSEEMLLSVSMTSAFCASLV